MKDLAGKHVKAVFIKPYYRRRSKMDNVVNIMHDIETVSLKPNAGIISIGACRVDDPDNFFYERINFETLDNRFHVDTTTLEWWGAQETAAQVEAFGGKTHIIDALDNYAFWLISQGTKDSLRMWGNGAMFDNVILGEAYKACGMLVPWSYKGDMCYRTVKNLFHSIEEDDFVGVKHTALADAQHQARHLNKIFSYIISLELNKG
jgi:hypothetical protein